jgi:hypothetical protein
MKIDPIIKERLQAIALTLNSLELDESLWDENNPVWQNTNNHVMLMMRRYYHENEIDPEMHAILGPIIDHFVWLYVIDLETRARIGWIAWFLIVYVTDNQFKQDTGRSFNPEIWNDPRNWILAKEAKNEVTTVLIPNDTVPVMGLPPTVDPIAPSPNQEKSV